MRNTLFKDFGSYFNQLNNAQLSKDGFNMSSTNWTIQDRFCIKITMVAIPEGLEPTTPGVMRYKPTLNQFAMVCYIC